ncbi:MAG: hypothetical protein PHW83_01950 [Bacteroidales bacterium]|nr:hypothetical protein [Bacteroidales bacterium]
MNKESIKRSIESEKDKISSLKRSIEIYKKDLASIRDKKKREMKSLSNRMKNAKTPSQKADIKRLKENISKSTLSQIISKQKEIDYKKLYIKKSKEIISNLNENLLKLK